MRVSHDTLVPLNITNSELLIAHPNPTHDGTERKTAKRRWGRESPRKVTCAAGGCVCAGAGVSWWEGSSFCRGSFQSVQLLKRNLCLSPSPLQVVMLTEGISAKERGKLPYGDTAGCTKQLPELCLIQDHVQHTFWAI